MNKHAERLVRHKRIRTKIGGTEKKMRLSIYRSNKYLFGQIINDAEQKTLLGISAKIFKSKKKKTTKTEEAGLLGLELAKKAVELGIKKVVFDRGGYRYHGRIKALAEGARKGGLQF